MPEPRQLLEHERRWYVGTLLHALNQPLTALGSYVEAALGAAPADADPVLREALQSSRVECVRAIAVARELRTVLGSRAELAVGSVDLNELFEDLAPDLPGEAGTRVRLELDRSVGDVRADAFSLRRAVLALVQSGASRFRGNGSGQERDLTAVLRTHPAGDAVQAEVQIVAEGSGQAHSPSREELPGANDPLQTLARSALADVGGELILGPAEPGSLVFQIRLATV